MDSSYRMSHCVPDFEMDQEDYSIPTTSRTLTSSLAGESEIMELLWQNGQLVAHPQNQRLLSKSSPLSKTTVTPPPPTPPQPPSSAPPNNSLYMAEDEMATWLHYPLEEFYSDFLYSNPAPPPPPPQLPAHQPSTVALSRPIVSLHSPPQQPPQPQPQPRPHVPQSQTPPAGNFQLFSRMRSGNVSQPLTSFRSGLTVVNSSDTRSTAAPTAAAAAPVDSTVVTSAPPATAPQVGRSLTVREGSGDLTMLSSTSASGSACSTPSAPAPTASPNATAATTSTTDVKERSRKSEGEDRKRKGRDMDEYYAAATTTTTTASEPIFEDVELDSADEKKHTRGSSGTKRSRAAEVHNLSERRRRDRINERMRALQELIPRCNKSDKASMLDEAIEYLKSLQMQVQMMSMGCGMVPMMYPGMQQQYIAPMGMGRGMGMDMSMARPLMPFPPTIPGPLMPAPPAVVAPQLPQLAPRMHVPPLVIPSVPATELSRNQASNQADSNRSSFAAQSTGLAQLPNLADPYQYLAFQQMQMQMQMQMQAAQSQSQSQPGSSKPTTKAIDDV